MPIKTASAITTKTELVTLETVKGFETVEEKAMAFEMVVLKAKDKAEGIDCVTAVAEESRVNSLLCDILNEV